MKSVADIRGFHAHVYFDDATRACAQRLRDGVAAFPVELGGWHEAPVGPHTKAMYHVEFGADQFGAVVSWLMLNREGLSILVHPRTGDEIADHSTNPLWLGEQVPINFDFLHAYMQRLAG